MTKPDKIVTLGGLSDAMKRLAATRRATFDAMQLAKQSAADFERLKEQCRVEWENVKAGMEGFDVKDSGNYGWEMRFLEFIDVLCGNPA
jgi:hypothetical protein